MWKYLVEWTTLLLVLLCSPTRAQTTNTTCVKNSTTSWLFNSNGDSPCLVWSRLQSLCLPTDVYINVPPLTDPSFAYTPPRTPTICQCNEVVYSLMAACTFCQLGSGGSWVDEPAWRGECGAAWSTGLGFGESVVGVPAFAWRSWEGQRWDPVQAATSASLYTTNTPTGPTSLTRSFPAPSAPSPTPPSPTTSPSVAPSTGQNTTEGGKFEWSKWGPMIGGIAGGLLLLLIVFFVLRRISKKPTKRTPYPIASPADLPTPQRPASRFLWGKNDREMKRDTEIITHPLSFRDPRPAPKPEEADNPQAGYRTTSQRLADRTSSSSEGATLAITNGPDSPEDIPTLTTYTNPKHPPTPSQDFSAPRPFSSNTLPSLYDPPTGAPTYRNTTYSNDSALASPVSRYVPTERDSSAAVGAALGSARGHSRRARGSTGYWSRQSLPPVPRNVSDESR